MEFLIEILEEYVYYFQKSLKRIFVGDVTKKIEGDNRTPIICLPGIFGGATLTHIEKYLRKTSRTGLILDAGFELGHLNSYLEKIHKQVEKEQFKKYTLIGYSMGGLIFLLYADKYGWDKIEKLITIASPFKGSQACRYLAFIPAANDMCPQSELLERLNKIEVPKNKIVCCYFKDDLFVKKESAIFKNEESYEFRYGGHFNNSQSRNYLPFFKKYLL